jgi:hypothetical protein
MKPNRDPGACLLVKVHVPTGCTEPRIDACLCVRARDERDGHDYPRSPDNVNGLHCDHGSLGFRSWVFDGRASGCDGPGYERLSYVDWQKLEACTKTVRTLRARLEKMAQTRGHTLTFSEYAIRFAEACGAGEVCFPVETLHRIDRANGHARTLGVRWAFVKVGQAASMLRDLEASFAPSAERAAS